MTDVQRRIGDARTRSRRQQQVYPQQQRHSHDIAADPATPTGVLAELSRSPDPQILLALVHNPTTSAESLRDIASGPSIVVRKALLDSERCPLVSSVAEDRLAFEGVDVGLFVDERSQRRICRALIGTAHRAETQLLFSDPSFRVLDRLRTLHSLFTIHGGKKRDRKLNRHDYLRFLGDFNALGGHHEALDLPFITLLQGIRILGQERLVTVLTQSDPARAIRTLRLLESVVGGPDEQQSSYQQDLLQRWMGRHADWAGRLHDYLQRKHRLRVNVRRRRPPRTLFQASFQSYISELNRRADSALRIHLPRTENELRTLGETMANCIGSEHNISDAVAGNHLIFHAHPNNHRRRGVTCQFDSNGKLLQARGFANEAGDEALIKHAELAMESLLNHISATQLHRQPQPHGSE